jgi:hypothetical protein
MSDRSDVFRCAGLIVMLSGALTFAQDAPSAESKAAGKPGFQTTRAVQIPPPPLQPRILDSTGVTLVEAPDLGGYDSAVCDDDGNAYYHVGAVANYNDSTLFRLSHDPGEHKVYRLPPETAKDLIFGAFNVTPSGKVWVAAFNQQGEMFAYSFDSDGQVASHVRFDVPPYLQPRELAAFETGAFLLKGYFADQAGPRLAGHQYAAILAPSGEVARNLNLNLPAADKKAAAKHIPEGSVTVGSDGNAYLLLPDQIIVVSQSGQVVRRLPYQKPDAESRAVSLFVSGGLAAITLFKVNQHKIDTTLLVLDTNTGDVFGYYKPSEELGNNPLCFSRADGFTFMRRAHDGRIEFLSAALR